MTMTNEVSDDLAFVKRALNRSDTRSGPAAIYFMWAAIVMLGFPLSDFGQPWMIAWYWWTVPVAGGIASAVMGKRWERKRGEVNRELGKRTGWHWALMTVAIFLSAAPAAAGQVSWDAAANQILLIVALGYLLASLHLDPLLLPCGILMLLCYGAHVLVPDLPYLTTLTGFGIGLSLLVAGLGSSRQARRAAQTRA